MLRGILVQGNGDNGGKFVVAAVSMTLCLLSYIRSSNARGRFVDKRTTYSGPYQVVFHMCS